jgi:hypothetical protein
MVMRYPALLGLSIDNNLRPKLHYLVDEVKIEQQVIRQQVTSEREGEGESGMRREGGREGGRRRLVWGMGGTSCATLAPETLDPEE